MYALLSRVRDRHPTMTHWTEVGLILYTAVVRPGAVGSGIGARLRPTRYFSQREGRGRGSECCIKRMRGCAWSVGCTVPYSVYGLGGLWLVEQGRDEVERCRRLHLDTAGPSRRRCSIVPVPQRYVDCGNDFGATRTAERTSACGERRWFVSERPRRDTNGGRETEDDDRCE